MQTLPVNSLWRAAGLRWIASLFSGLADRLDRGVRSPGDDQYFDSDAYLAELKNRIYNR